MDASRYLRTNPLRKRMENFGLTANDILKNAEKQARKAKECTDLGNYDGASAWKRLEETSRREANFLLQQKSIVSEIINNPKVPLKCA